MMSAHSPNSVLGRVVVVSPERWDEVWRRNQHLASRLPALGLADHVTFVNPAAWSGAEQFSPVHGVTVVSPRRRIPKRLAGNRVLAWSLMKEFVRNCDTLWINDASIGAWLSGLGPVAYDVTDDWRMADLKPRVVRRLVAAEDILAGRARTIVCSEELRRRWKARYGIEASVVRNAVDTGAIRAAIPRDIPGEGPHIGYVGTLHESRLDVELVVAIAAGLSEGTVHLVGPDCLRSSTRVRLQSQRRITLHGSVPADDVPSWLLSFDVLVCPHRVDDFTLSLDAIKAYEYLATPKPVVATPTSGFQEIAFPGLTVRSEGFVGAVRAAAAGGSSFTRHIPDWDDRAREFARAVAAADARG